MFLGVCNKGNSGSIHMGIAGSPTFQAGIFAKSLSSFLLDFSASAFPLPFAIGFLYCIVKITIGIELISHVSKKLFCIFTRGRVKS